MTAHRYRVPFLFLALLLTVNPAYAVTPTAVISPDGSMYVIECSGFFMARSAEIVVDYPFNLGQPEVLPGGLAQDSAMTVSSIPSMLRIDFKVDKGLLPSGGTLVYLLFPNARMDAPVPVGLSGTVVGVDGKRVSIKAWYQGPNDPPKEPEPDNTDDEQTTGTGSAAAKAAEPAPQAGSGEGDRSKAAAVPAGSEKTVPLPVDPPPKPIPAQAPAIEADPPRGNGPLGKPLPPVQTFQSVLDRFKSFKGEPTEAALRRLFDPDPGAPFRQAPAAAIADGRSPVTVTFILASPGQEVNVMVLTNIRMVSFRYLNDGTAAELIVLPEAGANRASLMVKAAERIFDLPLTVVPPLNPALAALGVSDGKLIRRDYNGDGVIDYLDDYFLMANRLALFQ